MASPVTESFASEAAIDAAASSRLAAEMSSASAEPTPDPSPVTESPSVQVSGTPETSPAQAPPASPSPAIAIDPNSLPPEARRFLEMNGGLTAEAIAKALSRGLEFNNRLGKRGQETTPPEAPGTEPIAAPVALPVQAAPTQAPPAPEPVLDEKAIEGQLNQFVAVDPECVQHTQQFRLNESRLQEIASQYPNLHQEIAYFSRRLQDADVKADTFLSGDIKEKLTELRAADLETRQLSLTNGAIEGAYTRRAQGYRQHLISGQEQINTQRRQAEQQQQQVHRAAEELTAAWPTALQQILTKHDIQSDKLKASFNKVAQQAALAELSFGMRVVDVPAFLEKQFEEWNATIDEGHRLRATQYGDLARMRTAQGGTTPTSNPNAVAATGEPHEIRSLDDIYRRERQSLKSLAG